MASINSRYDLSLIDSSLFKLGNYHAGFMKLLEGYDFFKLDKFILKNWHYTSLLRDRVVCCGIRHPRGSTQTHHQEA